MYFDHVSFSEAERRKIISHSTCLHHKLLADRDLSAYDQHLELAKLAYRCMLHKINQQQLVDDILFCGSSELSWEESSKSLSALYKIDLHGKEIYAFYYLHEINRNFYIDSPISTPISVTDDDFYKSSRN